MGFYQGLIPWAWIEASTKGAVLIFAASEIEDRTVKAGLSPAVAGLLGGMGGGIAQAYATMGECFFLTTLRFSTREVIVQFGGHCHAQCCPRSDFSSEIEIIGFDETS